MSKSVIVGGIYEHYKKLFYKVLAVARHSETLEDLVVYQALYGAGDLWVRPVKMFLEDVSIGDGLQPRFKFIKADALPKF
jgi:hypothetical protein